MSVVACASRLLHTFFYIACDSLCRSKEGNWRKFAMVKRDWTRILEFEKEEPLKCAGKEVGQFW